MNTCGDPRNASKLLKICFGARGLVDTDSYTLYLPSAAELGGDRDERGQIIQGDVAFNSTDDGLDCYDVFVRVVLEKQAGHLGASGEETERCPGRPCYNGEVANREQLRTAASAVRTATNVKAGKIEVCQEGASVLDRVGTVRQVFAMLSKWRCR